MTVQEILSAPKYLLDSTTVEEAIKFLKENKIGAVLVVNTDVELVGIFTERDLLMKVSGEESTHLQSAITDFMTENPKTVEVTDTIAQAKELMKAGRFRHVPVVNELHKPVGMISIRDIFMHE